MNPAVRIIAASGLTANENVVPSGGLGVRHFLTKPYSADALLQALKVCLGEWRDAVHPVREGAW